MKSKIAGIIIIILLIMMIIPSHVYCDEELPSGKIEYSQESFNRMFNEGKSNKKVGSQSLTQTIKPSFSSIPAINGITGTIICLPAMAIQGIMSYMINGSATDTITIQELVFNKSDLLNANYTELSSDSINKQTKQIVMMWFYAIRNIAAALSILVLLYAAIRMAISTVASEKAKYKAMIIDWIVGFAIIFLIQYIIVIPMAVSDTIVEFFASFNVQSFEKDLSGKIIEEIVISKGLKYFALVIMYLVVVYYQIKFMLIYAKRFLVIGFLIVISPLITVTYAIDRAGDGKAQALNSWLREFLANMFIQPLHAGIYIVFIATANEIFAIAPIFSIIMFTMMGRTEKIMKNIFGLKKMTTIQNMDDVQMIR